jgi:acyl-CoA synthetase (AMP-forming)/AMP-acid ligase II
MNTENIPNTIVDLLRERARREPDHVLYTVLDDRGEEARDITYAELDRRARAIAVRLRQFADDGDRVMQVFPAGADFLFAFYGTLYSGCVGIPLSRPGKLREARRLVNTAGDARPSCAMTTAEVLVEATELVRTGLGTDMAWIIPEDVDLALADEWRAPPLDADSLAYLQYTSGSTGNPKGVMITHKNVFWNQEMVRQAFEHGPETTTVSWLPHSHDMGLMSVLNPLFVNAKAVLMSPSSFVRDPLRWLRAISKYRGRTSGGPNFAYELCVRRLAKSTGDLGLDLSTWDVSYCGSEPVRAETLESFAEAFARYGFRRSALLPCYGLAEATLLVSGEKKSAGVYTTDFPQRPSSVSCGKPAPLQDVRIVNLDGFVECPDGVEGEVWVAGAHVSSGYFGKPVETEATFGWKIEGVEGRFLRTGDLGLLHAGTIHVTGRIRDILIVHGQNHYPQDIEATAERADPHVRAAGCAAFSLESAGGERVGIVVEVARLAPGESQGVCENIRAAVSAAHDVHLDVVVLIAPQSLLKTTSGKVERQSMRRSFLEGRLRAVGYSSHLGKQDEPWDRAYRDIDTLAPVAMAPGAFAAAE